MNRISWLRASAVAIAALITSPMLTNCSAERNDFIGTWIKANEAPNQSAGGLSRLVIDKATVDFTDATGGSASPTATYKVISDDEAVATGVFGMSMKLQLVDHNTLTISSPQATFTRA